MKIYITTDLEGVAGVVDHRQQCWFDGKYYGQARRLATLELNALVEGLLEAGAKDIFAWDGHAMFPGSIDIEILHPECRLIMGAGDGGPVGMDKSYNALFQIGIHAMADTAKASMAHGGWELNGRKLGEIGMNALLAGLNDIPFVFVSGDKAAAKEATALVTGVETAIVKWALSEKATGLAQAATVSLSPEKARQIIKRNAIKAVGKIGEIKPFKIDPPYLLNWRFFNTEEADKMLNSFPEAKRIDDLTLEFKADDFCKLPLV
ncbi:MAG: M55 family metallopeptidase [candidate division Zixibacteria bacterium]|nr:M55 family metallopeptidase [candidate division Zixibacteria bacterium]